MRPWQPGICAHMITQFLHAITGHHFGEVDLIAQKDGVLVYVEVKYRSSNDYGDPLEAVDRRKQRQICKVANYHYAGYAAGQEMDCRFDVIGILWGRKYPAHPKCILFQR